MSEIGNSPEEIYAVYQRNTRLSEQLQEDVMRGAREGENVFSLLLKCAKAISLLTDSDVFYRQVEQSVTAVYGEALGESAPLEMELERTRERMQRIRAASETCENEELRQAMLNAVRAHEQRIALLEKRLQEG